MRISDWSSDVCSSDLGYAQPAGFRPPLLCAVPSAHARRAAGLRRGGAGAGHGRLGSGAARPAGAADGPAAGRYGDLLLDLQHPEGAEADLLRRLPHQAGGADPVARVSEVEDLCHAVTHSGLPPLARRPAGAGAGGGRSEEHTSELQSLMRISYAVFCLKKKTYTRCDHT